MGLKMIDLPKVKIVGNGLFCKVIEVDGHQMRMVTSIELDLMNPPHKLKLEMLAEVEIVTVADIEKKIYAWVGNRRYELNDMIKNEEIKREIKSKEVIQKIDTVRFTDANNNHIIGNIIKKGISQEFDGRGLYIIEAINDKSLWLRYEDEVLHES
jgi:hypothetical protein